MSNSVESKDIVHITKRVRMFQKNQEHLGAYIPQVDLDDLIGRCIDRWDSTEGKYVQDIASRKTFINAVIKRELQDFLRRWGRQKRKNPQIFSLNTPIDENRELLDMLPDFRYAPDRPLLEAELNEKLSEIFPKLTRRQKEVYCLIGEGLGVKKFTEKFQICQTGFYGRKRRIRKVLIKEGVKGFFYKSKAFPYFWQCSRRRVEEDI